MPPGWTVVFLCFRRNQSKSKAEAKSSMKGSKAARQWTWCCTHQSLTEPGGALTSSVEVYNVAFFFFFFPKQAAQSALEDCANEQQPIESWLLPHFWYLLCFLVGKPLALNVKIAHGKECWVWRGYLELDTDSVCVKKVQCINPMLNLKLAFRTS